MGAYKSGAVTPIKRGKHVAVVGAGNVAMDAARTAKRLGADTVTVVYRRSRAEMPARREEIRHAEEEGIRFELLAAPVEILGEDGFAAAMRCVRMALGEPDASGRRAPIAVEGSEFTLSADLVIVALGTCPNPLLKDSYPDLATSGRGTLTADKAMRTNIKRVYAGGDAVTGAATVISAMGQGRMAAKTMLADFRDEKE
jgi:glutamate synthase (NADPH/NADH) small chain